MFDIFQPLVRGAITPIAPLNIDKLDGALFWVTPIIAELLN
jgi:hypothetical protein